MSEFIPKVPRGCEVVGRLYDTEDVEFLTGDMLEVYCPETSVLIRAGWSPAEDVTGQYIITAHCGCTRARNAFRTKNIKSAMAVITDWATSYQPRAVRKGRSSQTVFANWPPDKSTATGWLGSASTKLDSYIIGHSPEKAHA